MILTKKHLQQICNDLKIHATDDVLEKALPLLQIYIKLDASERYYFLKGLLIKSLVEISKK